MVAEEVNWGEYFASIVSVCPWSRAYWLLQQIDIRPWTGEVSPLGDNAARVYTHPEGQCKDLEKDNAQDE